jgi:hypothetical protein
MLMSGPVKAFAHLARWQSSFLTRIVLLGSKALAESRDSRGDVGYWVASMIATLSSKEICDRPLGVAAVI